MAAADRDAHLNALWALLPRANRAEFQNRVRTNPNNEYFTDGPDTSHVGRGWYISTGDFPAPAAQQALIPIVDMLELTAENRKNFRDLLIAILRTYLGEIGGIEIPAEPAQEGGRRSNSRHSRRNNSRHSRRSNSRRSNSRRNNSRRSRRNTRRNRH